MGQSELHLLFLQMGEVLSGIRGLHDTIDIRQAQAEQLHDVVRSDLAALRRDHRDLEEKLECVISVMQRDVGMLRSGVSENARGIRDLVGAVQALRRPVAEIVALKARFAGLLLGAGVVGSGVLWLAEPVYRWVVEARILKR